MHGTAVVVVVPHLDTRGGMEADYRWNRLVTTPRRDEP